MGNFSKHLEYSPYTYNLSNGNLHLKNIMTKMKILLVWFISIRNSTTTPPKKKRMNKSDRREVENIQSNTQGEKTQQNLFETCRTEGKCLTGLMRDSN